MLRSVAAERQTIASEDTVTLDDGEKSELTGMRATVFIVETTRFDLGNVVVTKGALELLNGNGQDVITLLLRHANCDWGDICEEDKAANDRAFEHGDSLFSAYDLADASKIWIITEHDRSVTTLLRPDEY